MTLKEKLEDIKEKGMIRSNHCLIEVTEQAVDSHGKLVSALRKLVDTSKSNEKQLADELYERFHPSSALIEAAALLKELEGL